eukprot:Platyproteum_vivax@DN3527_c0_g1_i2.p1
MSHSMKLPGHKLRELMQNGCVTLPGAFNGLVARMCVEAGFEACYISGAAVSASAGLPDIGVHPLSGFLSSINQVTSTSGLPCLVDADTGFGELEQLPKTVHNYFQAGAAGFHIEDQVFPKRCGHLDGKSLVPTKDFALKVAAAAQSRDSLTNGSFIVCARTDARAVEGMESAIERAKAYVEAGADMIFPEGLTNIDEFKAFAAALKPCKGEAPGGGPYLLANMTEFGKTPYYSVAEFADAGYHCVIFPVSTLRCAMRPVQEMLRMLKEEGSVEDMVKQMYTRKELYQTLQYTPGVEWKYPATPKPKMS